MKQAEQICGNCRWFFLLGDESGICLVNPPTNLDSKNKSERPDTYSKFTCKEFKASEAFLEQQKKEKEHVNEEEELDGQL